jgi:hypothetical protein
MFTLMDFKGVKVPCEGVELVSEPDSLLGKIDAFHDLNHGIVRGLGVRAWS